MIVRSTRVAARRTRRLGFTLMEVLVVVAILVVLAGTGGVIYMNFLEGAKEDAAKTQVQALAQAAEAYRIKYNDFPASLDALTTTMPDGKPATLDTTALYDPWQQRYQYQYPGSHHQGTNKPDIWTVSKEGKTIGNWSDTGRGI